MFQEHPFEIQLAQIRYTKETIATRKLLNKKIYAQNTGGTPAQRLLLTEAAKL
jgi:hypothetical protein